MTRKHLSLAALAALALLACSSKTDDNPLADAGAKDSSEPMVKLTKEELMKPETCKECHARHYREWASSMHAYAAKDPIFLAMNKRGQEETDGELGDFCVKCHAPLAVAMGLTKDGLNLDELPEETKGVTCYFCHNVENVSDVHDNVLGLPANNPLELAMDDVLRGGMGRPGEEAKNPPANSPAHKTEYSQWLDGDDLESGKMCGSCHDIVTPAGVHLERTYKEWLGSVHANPEVSLPNQSTCIDCHMLSRSGVAAESPKIANVSFRQNGVHAHLFPGVDVALTAHPDVELQKQAILCDLADTLIPYYMDVAPDGTVTVEYDAAGTGHGWPSGATQDRRAFLRLRAFDAEGNIMASSGDVALDQSVMEAYAADPGMAVLRDYMLDADGSEVHMFWDAVSVEAKRSLFSGAPVGTTPAQHAIDFKFLRFFRGDNPPAEIEAMFFIRPIGHEVIDDLLDTGHLQQLGFDESIKNDIPTFPLHGSRIVWNYERDRFSTIRKAEPLMTGCRKDLACMLDDKDCETSK